MRPSSREAVIRSTASAAPGRSVRKPERVVDDVHEDVARRADGGGRRPVEHRRHLAEHRARGVDPGERHAVALDDHLARDEHEHPARSGPLGDEHVARRHGLDRQVGAEGEQVGHAPSLLERARHG